MELSQEMKTALSRHFSWSLCHVPELETPTLVVFDYSPRSELPPLSIAFDYHAGPKCWLSESTVRPIGTDGPKPHTDYRSFQLRGRLFHPYSLQPLPRTIFHDIQEFNHTCLALYTHVDWSG